MLDERRPRSRARARARVWAPVALALALVVGWAAPAPAADTAWSVGEAPLTTRWTDEVTAEETPLDEYPRPQLTRTAWKNLNGLWDFTVTDVAVTTPPTAYDERIMVPFVAESALSGVQRKITEDDRLWYRRTFTVPRSWDGSRVVLNFGGVDWRTDVWVNGVKVGATHSGGYDAFSYDITARLTRGATATLEVGVWDPTDSGGQAVGKQRVQEVTAHAGGGIWYTAASGIWQTVWLEPVADRYVQQLALVPDLGTGTVRVTATGKGTTSADRVRVVVSADGRTVGTATGQVGRAVAVHLRDVHEWSPDDPYLYDVTVTLVHAGRAVDTVGSYTGMREVGVAEVDGELRLTLNGEAYYHSGVLDQGYWPDGIYTAPTDEALRFDLQAAKDLGFTMVRKHIKVEPQRWYYWADTLGILVWQDMPSMTTTPDADEAAQWEAEYQQVVAEHLSSPSVVMWVDQNEGWGQYDQARIADLVATWDPTRLVDVMSGVNCCGSVDGGNGDVVDHHVYVGPGLTVPSSTRAAVLGEFGGLGLEVTGHEWSPGDGFSYEDQADAARLAARLDGLWDQLVAAKARGLSASVYTEITDVENEANGLLTYDREVVKVDVAAFAAANAALVAAPHDPASAEVAPGPASLRVTTTGYTDRYVRHSGGAGYTAVVTGSSDDLLKADATWTVVPGLADPSCYSFASANYPDQYLRHQAYRVRLGTDDGTALMHADATWCAEPGADGTVRFSSYNYPGQYLRHYDAELWLAVPGGPAARDTATAFEADTSWSLEAPWAS